jgi:hypothetical protein
MGGGRENAEMRRRRGEGHSHAGRVRIDGIPLLRGTPYGSRVVHACPRARSVLLAARWLEWTEHIRGGLGPRGRLDIFGDRYHWGRSALAWPARDTGAYERRAREGCGSRRRTRCQPGLRRMESEAARGLQAGIETPSVLRWSGPYGQERAARPAPSPLPSSTGRTVTIRVSCITGPAGMQCYSAARHACVRGMRGRVDAWMRVVSPAAFRWRYTPRYA